MRDTFEQWKVKVDRAVQEACGLSADDLPDWDYRTAYEDRVSPGRAAAQVIRAAREG